MPDLVLGPGVIGLGTKCGHRTALSTPHQDLVEELSIGAACHVFGIGEVRGANEPFSGDRIDTGSRSVEPVTAGSTSP